MLPLVTGRFKSFPGSFFDLCKVLHLWSRYLFHCGIDFRTSWKNYEADDRGRMGDRSAAWKTASGLWNLSTAYNSRKKTHRSDPSWSGRCVCLAEIFPVCFHPLKPPGVRHCNIASGGLSISIPLRFSYWKLTCHEFQKVEHVLHGWRGGTQFFQCSVFCHPNASKTTAENGKTAGWQGPNLLCKMPLFFE